jgi:hypothetical protein
MKPKNLLTQPSTSLFQRCALALALSILTVLPGLSLATETPTTKVASAEDLANAKVLVGHWRALPKSSEFEKWQRDMWMFSLFTCLRETGVAVPPDLAAHRVSRASTHRLTTDVPKMCEALKKGPSAVCHGLNTQQPPFEFPHSGLPSNYAFLGERGAEDGANVVVGGDCDLVASKRETRQFFVGSAKLRWSEKPRMQELQTASGKRMVKMGNAEFQTSAPGFHMVTVIAR